jgi:hypothetical protein
MYIRINHFQKAYDLSSAWLEHWHAFLGDGNPKTLQLQGLIGESLLKLDTINNNSNIDYALNCLHKYSLESQKNILNYLQVLEAYYVKTRNEQVKQRMQEAISRFELSTYWSFFNSYISLAILET